MRITCEAQYLADEADIRSYQKTPSSGVSEPVHDSGVIC
jgi:hypothetical protein